MATLLCKASYHQGNHAPSTMHDVKMHYSKQGMCPCGTVQIRKKNFRGNWMTTGNTCDKCNGQEVEEVEEVKVDSIMQPVSPVSLEDQDKDPITEYDINKFMTSIKTTSLKKDKELQDLKEKLEAKNKELEEEIKKHKDFVENTEARKKENIKKREGLRTNLADEIASKEKLIKEHCKENQSYVQMLMFLKNELKVEKEAHNKTKKLLKDKEEAHNNIKKLLEDKNEQQKKEEELLESYIKEVPTLHGSYYKTLPDHFNDFFEIKKLAKERKEVSNAILAFEKIKESHFWKKSRIEEIDNLGDKLDDYEFYSLAEKKLLNDEKEARLATIKEKDDKVKLVIEMENKLEKLVGENDILEEKIKSYDMKIKKLKETYKNNIKKNNRYKIEMKKECLQFKETLLAAMDSVPKIFDTQTVNEDLADDDAEHFTKSSELEDAECITGNDCSSSNDQEEKSSNPSSSNDTNDSRPSSDEKKDENIKAGDSNLSKRYQKAIERMKKQKQKKAAAAIAARSPSHDEIDLGDMNDPSD